MSSYAWDPRRQYPAKKVQENVQCEIMMVVLEEAMDSYRCVSPHSALYCVAIDKA